MAKNCLKYLDVCVKFDFLIPTTLKLNDDAFFFSRDITVPRPQMGEYYFMLVAYKDFHELLGMVSYQMSTITFLTIII